MFEGVLARVQGMEFASEANVRGSSLSAAVLANRANRLQQVVALTPIRTSMQPSRRWPDRLQRRCGEALAGDLGLSRRASTGGTEHQFE